MAPQRFAISWSAYRRGASPQESSEPGRDGLVCADMWSGCLWRSRVRSGNKCPFPGSKAWMRLLLRLAAARVIEDGCQNLRALMWWIVPFILLDHSVEVDMSERKSSVAAQMTVSASSSSHGLEGLVLLRPDSMSLDKFDVTQSPPSQRPNTIL